VDTGDVELEAHPRPLIHPDHALDLDRVVELEGDVAQSVCRDDALSLTRAVLDDDERCSGEDAEPGHPAADDDRVAGLGGKMGNERARAMRHGKRLSWS
jgi:hypothetical protein